MMQAPLIECIGDSHVCFFLGKDYVGSCYPDNSSVFPFFRPNTIGPALAYNLCEKGTSTRGRENLFAILKNSSEGCYVLFAFGEIDCRAHLLLHAHKINSSIESVVKTCTERYSSVVSEVAQLGFKPIVYNAPASTWRRPSWNPKVQKSFPSYGTCKERNQVTKIFNDQMKQFCDDKNYLFLHNYDFLVNKKGISKRRYYLDRIHLAQRAMPETLERLKKLMPHIYFEIPKGWKLKVLLSYMTMRLR